MELKITEYQLPEISISNFEELKKELIEKAEIYKNMVYTDDQIQEAKKDRTQLNKFIKALNDERIRCEKNYMIPFKAIKAQFDELSDIARKPADNIDQYIRSVENKQKDEKLEQIKALWEEMDVPDGLPLDAVFEPKMLNVSYGMNHVKQKMLDDIKRFKRNMETLAALPEFGFEAQKVYLETLDINKALAEGQRMARIQKEKEANEAEIARKKAEEEAKLPVTSKELAESRQEYVAAAAVNGAYPKAEPVRQWVSFKAFLSMDQALALKKFFEDANIEFQAI